MKKRPDVLLIDNYDSFTYNVRQRLGELGIASVIFRNDAITIAQIEDLAPRRIIISPGPCTPNEAGISNEAIRHFGSRIPILGICLGHQCIGQVYGGKVVRARKPMHGKTSLIYHDEQTIFHGVKNPFQATRYHSLVVERDSIPTCLSVSAETADGVIMGFRHSEYKVEGIQCHPESYLTPDGYIILRNFLEL